VTDARNHSDREHAADPAPATSTTLLDLAKGGDPLAWQRLVFLHTPLVRWWCRRQWVCQPYEIEDVTQEVFVTVAGKLAGFSKGPAGSFRSWLYTITRYKIGDHRRRAQGEPVAEGGSSARERLEELPEALSNSSTDEEDRSSERAILVRRALELVRSEFQPRTWEAAWRVVVDGQRPAEVGAALGMSAGAVHTAKSRVLGRLRVLLRDLLADPADDAASPAAPDAGP
jgi:RNA polymerase sigma-70 factor (ECF subfamily)